MVLYALCCVCNVLASSRTIWYDPRRGTSAFSGVGGFSHSWLSELDWDQTHTKASKNHNNIAGEEQLDHIRTIVVSLGGKITYLFICSTELLHRRYDVIFGVLTLFCYWWHYFVDCGLVELLGLVGAFFVVYGFFGCLWLRLGHWVGMKIPMSHEGNVETWESCPTFWCSAPEQFHNRTAPFSLFPYCCSLYTDWRIVFWLWSTWGLVMFSWLCF
jgi:hypothetical protein